MASVLMAWRWYDWLALLLLLLSGLTAWALWRAPRPARPSAIVQRWFPVGALVFAGVVVLASVQAALFSEFSTSSKVKEEGLVAHWRFLQSQDRQLLDSVSGYPAFLYHPQWFIDRQSLNLSVLRLDGVSGYVEIPSIPSSIFDGSFTISAWVQVDSTRERQSLVQLADPEGDLRRAAITFYVPWGEGRLGLVLSDGTRRVGFLSDGKIGARRWLQVGVSFEKESGQIRFFIDGEVAGERTTTWRPPSQRPQGALLLGLAGSPDRAWHRFRGELLILRIYQRALSPDEVSAIIDMKPEEP